MTAQQLAPAAMGPFDQSLPAEDHIRSMPTLELVGLYRDARLVVDCGDVLDPWVTVALNAARELRFRAAREWLHARWCLMPDVCPLDGWHLTQHNDAAWDIVAAYEASTPGLLSVAACRGAWPDSPATAREAAYMAACPAFLALVARLVEVVPSEVTA
ncbi:hypothetical protein [Sphaerisporangium sp. TRM90804]|uniref:hypothetical protein n=1 Tax=Sphaerisporangium sp. TRM90804 TaxID=3031113 RepID=UPI00244CEB37|nr:hypothetical protein [Sphaerisporangium sp. TRM90804]MDH2424852.1 hypothetical protein [Sphaerisporangium sp. TRM90804]